MTLEPNDVLLAEAAGEGILLLTVNRPAQRNAIDPVLLHAMNAAFDACVQDDRWRVGVWTGAPPAFCAGLGLKTFSAPDMFKSVIDRGMESTLADALAIETETLQKRKAMDAMAWSSGTPS